MGRPHGRRTDRSAGPSALRTLGPMRHAAAVGVANLLQELAGLAGRVFHGNRRILDLQRVGLGNQQVGGGQIVFPYRLACGAAADRPLVAACRPAGNWSRRPGLRRRRRPGRPVRRPWPPPQPGSPKNTEQVPTTRTVRSRSLSTRFSFVQTLWRGRRKDLRPDSHDELGDEIKKMFARRSG